MRTTLPRGSRQKLLGFALTLSLSGACSHPPPPVPPGPPIPAPDELVVDTYDKECDALIAALTAYGTCVNLDDADRAWIHDDIEFAQRSFAAGKKGLEAHPDKDASRAMAQQCRRAAASIGYAHQRCDAGPKPRADY
jgi:hypothetical protein